MKIFVVGSGAWGTALAMLLAGNGHTVSLWTRTEEKAGLIRTTRCNPALTGVRVPEEIRITAALEQAVRESGCNYRVGTIASGDMFLHTAERKQFIVEHFGAIAGEMEGASIGQVCYLNKVPFVVLRTISDDASGHAPASFETFAGEAAVLACGIVRRFAALMEG